MYARTNICEKRMKLNESIEKKEKKEKDKVNASMIWNCCTCYSQPLHFSLLERITGDWKKLNSKWCLSIFVQLCAQLSCCCDFILYSSQILLKLSFVYPFTLFVFHFICFSCIPFIVEPFPSSHPHVRPIPIRPNFADYIDICRANFHAEKLSLTFILN